MGAVLMHLRPSAPVSQYQLVLTVDVLSVEKIYLSFKIPLLVKWVFNLYRKQLPLS